MTEDCDLFLDERLAGTDAGRFLLVRVLSVLAGYGVAASVISDHHTEAKTLPTGLSAGVSGDDVWLYWSAPGRARGRDHEDGPDVMLSAVATLLVAERAHPDARHVLDGPPAFHVGIPGASDGCAVYVVNAQRHERPAGFIPAVSTPDDAEDADERRTAMTDIHGSVAVTA